MSAKTRFLLSESRVAKAEEWDQNTTEGESFNYNSEEIVANVIKDV